MMCSLCLMSVPLLSVITIFDFISVNGRNTCLLYRRESISIASSANTHIERVYAPRDPKTPDNSYCYMPNEFLQVADNVRVRVETRRSNPMRRIVREYPSTALEILFSCYTILTERTKLIDYVYFIVKRSTFKLPYLGLLMQAK